MNLDDKKEKNVFREHYLNEVEYFSHEVPGVGEYNVSTFGKNHVGVVQYPKNLPKKNILEMRKADGRHDK